MERDIISINVDAVTFSLNKFPLLASSGKLRRMAKRLEYKDLGSYFRPVISSSSGSEEEEEEEEEEETGHAKYRSIKKHHHSQNWGGAAPTSASDSMPVLKLKGFPGGADAFELIVKCCNGINVEITTRKVAPLLCAAYYLELNTLFGKHRDQLIAFGSAMNHLTTTNSPDHMRRFLLYSGIHLVSRCEAFLDEIVSATDSSTTTTTTTTIERCVDVLHSCIPILREAEKLKIINRCIDAIVSSVCKLDVSSPKVSSGHHPLRPRISLTPPFDAPNMTPSHASTLTMNHAPNGPINPQFLADHYRVYLSNYGLSCSSVVEHWARHISVLPIDLFQRVMAALKSRGVEKERLGGALIHYTEENLMKPLMERGALRYVMVEDHIIQGRGIMINKPRVRPTLDGLNNMVMGNYVTKAIEHEQRILAETLVSMLPKDNGLFHTGFLLGFLRASIVLDTTVACRMDLEWRVGLHLESASVNDFLVPILSHTSSDSTSHGAVANVYDVDLMQRIVATYLRKREEMGSHVQMESTSGISSDAENHGDSPSGGVRKVAKLIDQYLAEISTDAHLPSSKFMSLAELLPDYARSVHDGLYRAIDMYLKAHPMLPDMERTRMCKLLDCQKLSQEACAHAAQNERLPVQMVVQVLYFEQRRMRKAMATHESELTLTEDINVGGCVSSHMRSRPRSSDHALSLSEYHVAQCPPNMSGQSAFTRSPQHRTMDIDPSLKRENRELTRENQELKLDALRLQVRVNDLETENMSLKQQLAKGGRTNVGTTTASRGNASGREGLFSQFARRLGRMHIFSSSFHSSPKTRMPPGPPKQSRSRRHSIS